MSMAILLPAGVSILFILKNRSLIYYTSNITYILSDIFSHEQIRHRGGNLEIKLNAYDSKCFIVGSKKENIKR